MWWSIVRDPKRIVAGPADYSHFPAKDTRSNVPEKKNPNMIWGCCVLTSQTGQRRSWYQNCRPILSAWSKLFSLLLIQMQHLPSTTQISPGQKNTETALCSQVPRFIFHQKSCPTLDSCIPHVCLCGIQLSHGQKVGQILDGTNPDPFDRFFLDTLGYCYKFNRIGMIVGIWLLKTVARA